MKRRRLRILVALSLILSMAATLVSVCATAGFAKEIVIKHFMEAMACSKAWDPGIKLFNQKYEGKYRVEKVLVPWDGMREKAFAELLAKTGSYDVMSIAVQWMDVSIPYLEDLAPYVKQYGPDLNELIGTPMAHRNGKQFGLPIRLGMDDILYVRKDLIDKAGLPIPQTPDDFMAASFKLTEDADGDGTPEIYATGLELAAPQDVIMELMRFIAPSGGAIVDPEGGGVYPFMGKHGWLVARTLGNWRTLYAGGLTPTGIFTWSYTDKLSFFQQGKLAMAIQYSPRVTAVEDPTQSKVAGKVVYAPAPGVPPEEGQKHTASGWSLTIPNYISGERKTAAYEYVKFMVEYEAQIAMALNGNGPTHKRVFENEEYVKINPASKAIVEAGEYSYFAPEMTLKEAPKMGLVVSDLARDVILGKKEAFAAAKEIFIEVNKILKGED